MSIDNSSNHEGQRPETEGADLEETLKGECPFSDEDTAFLTGLGKTTIVGMFLNMMNPHEYQPYLPQKLRLLEYLEYLKTVDGFVKDWLNGVDSHGNIHLEDPIKQQYFDELLDELAERNENT